MRSAPTLNSWMMPFSSVAMIEKLALVRIAFCRAPASFPVFSIGRWSQSRRQSVCALGHTGSEQLAGGLQRFDPVEDHLGDGDQRRAEEQPPDAPQPAEEEQRDEQHR